MKHKNEVGMKLVGSLVFVLYMLFFNVTAYSQCQYFEGEVVSFNASNGQQSSDYITTYVLTDINNNILEISSTEEFQANNSGYYKIYSINYLNGYEPTDLQVGESISNLSSDCMDISEAFDITICPSSSSCYTCSDENVAFAISGGNMSYKTQYLLLDENGIILSVSDNPNLAPLSAGTYGIIALNFNADYSISNVMVGAHFEDIDSQCFELSDPFLFTVCDPTTITIGEDFQMCENQNVILTANVSNGEFLWSTGETSSSITVFPTLGANMYSLVFTNENGCQSEDDLTITVLVAPDLNAGTDVDICQGEMVTLTASGDPGFYTWSDGQTGQSIEVSPTTTSVYGVTLTDINDCFSTDEVEVVVNPGATVSASADESICLGETVTLTASGSTGTYTWSDGQTGQSIEVSPTSTTIYEVTVETSEGCEATDEVEVVVNPGATVSASGDENNICLGEVVTLTASGSTGTYTWSDGQEGQSIEVSPTTTTIYEVTVETGEGCEATDEVEVVVNPGATVSASGDENICLGEVVTLTASGSTGTYTWSDGQEGQSIEVSPTTTTIYEVTVETSEGCEAADEVEVVVNPGATVSASGDENICLGEVVTLTASGSTGTYTWSDGQEGQSIEVSPNTTTVYEVTVVTSQGCEASEEITVTVDMCSLCETYDCDIECSGCPGDISFLALTNSLSGNVVNTYVLTAEDGIILNTNELTEFDYVSEGIHFVFLVTHEVGSQVDNLEVGENILNVNGTVLEISEPLVLNICPLPNITVTDDLEICPGDIATLTAQGSAGTYTWSDGQLGESVSVNPMNSTTYGVTVESEDGCQAEEEVMVDVVDCGLCLEYTCPQECNYCLGDIELNISQGTVAEGYVTKYIQTDLYGEIIEISDNLSFSIPNNGIFFFFGINYLTDSTLNGLEVGKKIKDIDGDCFDISEPFIAKACDDLCSASLGNLVWNDQNANGIQDEGEEGIPNVLVELYDENDQLIDSQSTDENGMYLFSDLAEGNYYVRFYRPGGYLLTDAGKGTEENDSNVSGFNGNGTTDMIHLSIGEEELTVDAGYYRVASIGDMVWLEGGGDPDNYDEGIDMPLAGVTVNLIDASTNEVIRTMVTGESGTYSFFGLELGEYKVQFVIDKGSYEFVTSNSDSDTSDSDVTDFETGMTDIYTLDAGDNITHVDAGVTQIILPIKLLNFTGVYNATTDVNDLKWTTSTEINNKYFEVQRSLGLMNSFETIGVVEGGGTTYSVSKYDFEDKEIDRNGIYYYRLKQVDYSNEFAYSYTVAIEVKRETGNVSVYPNPARDFIKIEIDNAQGELINISMFDIRGKTVARNIYSGLVQDEFESLNINIVDYPQGIYYLRVLRNSSIEDVRIVIID